MPTLQDANFAAKALSQALTKTRASDLITRNNPTDPGGFVQVELVFRNGAVFDGTAFAPAGTVVRVSGGTISYVGPESDAGPLGAAEPVDLRGGTLFPGFIDAHVHPVFSGDRLCRCDLSGARTAPEYLEIIAAYAAAHPEAEWITGGGWSMEAFPGGIPTRELLDSVVSDRPVFLPNRDGHGAWVNTRALEIAGIEASTPDPADGRIERDAAGQPAGCLQEGAANLVSRLLPATTEDDWHAGLLAAQDYLLSLGITGWQDAIVGRSPGVPDPIGAYLRAARSGTLLANVVGALWWDRNRGIEQLGELIERRRDGQAGRFRATSVKMMLDGVAENHTAAMLEPYLDGHGCSTGHSGLDFIDPAELPRFVTALDAEGFQVHFHALGDRAVRNALDAIEAARTANGSSLRHHLAHLQVVHPDDIPRFARLSATANMQPLWAAHEPQMDELTIPFLGDRRSGWQYPFGSLLASGAALCAGSDWSVSSPNPLWGAHVAVNRSVPETAAESAAEPFLPEQALPRAAILAAYTSGSARVNGLEDVTGSVRPGLDADFAIVDADLATGPDHEIGQAAVSSTWVRGVMAYQANLAKAAEQDSARPAGLAGIEEERWAGERAAARRCPSRQQPLRRRSRSPPAAGAPAATRRQATCRPPRAWSSPPRSEPSRSPR
jgi:predicted amidohydrolase YtcJ